MDINDYVAALEEALDYARAGVITAGLVDQTDGRDSINADYTRPVPPPEPVPEP